MHLVSRRGVIAFSITAPYALGNRRIMMFNFSSAQRGFASRLGRAAMQTMMLAVMACQPGKALAQTPWPSRPIRLIVPSAPGGSNDVISRTLSQQLTLRLGQSVLIDNKPGAGGTLGTDYVAKAPADGYTLMFTSSSLTTNAAAGKKLPYDPVRDLQPVAKVASGIFIVTVNNQVPAKTFKQFIDYVKANPGKLNYGSAGIGGISHLGTELMLDATGLQMTHIAYKGMNPAFTDLMSGRIQMALPSLASVSSQLRAGTLRGLATTGLKRSELMPELPTVAESGVPGYELEIWWGVFAPAKTPRPIVDRLNKEIGAILTMPETKKILMREGAETAYTTPEGLGTLVSSELARWTKVIRDAHIVID
jgi:tripartite-type tricarboxylate transporter receptor subunit TctC